MGNLCKCGDWDCPGCDFGAEYVPPLAKVCHKCLCYRCICQQVQPVEQVEQ